MADIRPVTADFAVAPQLAPQDIAQVAAKGFRLLINNRPDGEAPGQPTSAAMAQAAAAAGLDYRYIPVGVGTPPGQPQAMREAMDAAGGPTLAFCRSGTRSITTWAQGLAQAGDRPRDELVELGRRAGYDLSGAL